MPFKKKRILEYYHVVCAFAAFEKAKPTTPVITGMDDIGGFDLIKDTDRVRIIQLMGKTNLKRQ